MPSSFESFTEADPIEATQVSEMHEPIQNLERGAAFYAAGVNGESGSDYTATLTPAPDDPYLAGMLVNLNIDVDNVAGYPDVTLDVNGVGPKPILKNGSQSLSAGDLKAGQIVSLVYDDAGDGAFKLLSTSSNFSFTQDVENTMLGQDALASNTGNPGIGNSAMGFQALLSNTVGGDNTALGRSALSLNTEGVQNTAVGSWSMINSTTGRDNTFVGYATGIMLSTGSNNILIGSNIPIQDGEADDQINIGNAFLRAAVTQAVSMRAGAVAYENSADTEVLDLTGRSGWLHFVDSEGSKCRAFVTDSTVAIEAGSVDWVASSTPASGEVGLYVSSFTLHLVLGSAAARSIGFFDQLIQF
jgi:hypothetical protein